MKKRVLKFALVTTLLVAGVSIKANAQAFHEGACVDGYTEHWHTITVFGFDTGIYMPGTVQTVPCS